MKKSTIWILATLGLVAALTGLTLAYGFVGFLAGTALCLVFLFGLSAYYKWKSKSMAQTLLPGESLVASGIVSESTYDETPAILIQGAGGDYRVLMADSRGNQAVLFVNPDLKRHANAYDLKSYLELHTNQGLVHFAPHQSLSVAKQPAYAQEILSSLLETGLTPKS